MRKDEGVRGRGETALLGQHLEVTPAVPVVIRQDRGERGGDTREKSLLPSRPPKSPCVPQVLQAPHDGDCPLFVHGDAEQLVAFP